MPQARTIKYVFSCQKKLSNNDNNNNNIRLISHDKPLDHNISYIYTSVTQDSYLALGCHAGQPMVLDQRWAAADWGPGQPSMLRQVGKCVLAESWLWHVFTRDRAVLHVHPQMKWDIPTAAAPASEVEAVVWSPTNMAAAKIAAVDFNKTSGSAMAEGPRDALVSRYSATTKYPYRMALFAWSYV